MSEKYTYRFETAVIERYREMSDAQLSNCVLLFGKLIEKKFEYVMPSRIYVHIQDGNEDIFEMHNISEFNELKKNEMVLDIINDETGEVLFYRVESGD